MFLLQGADVGTISAMNIKGELYKLSGVGKLFPINDNGRWKVFRPDTTLVLVTDTTKPKKYFLFF